MARRNAAAHFRVTAIALMAIGIVLVKPILERQPLLWVTGLRMLGGVAGMLVIAAQRGELARLLPTRNPAIGTQATALAYTGACGVHWPGAFDAVVAGRL